MKHNIIITGSTGMVGKGILMECLDHPEVGSVVLINRRAINVQHEKIKEIIIEDFFDLKSIEPDLEGYNGCFFCLGVSAFRMSESDYGRITYDLTLNFAQTLLRLNHDMIFCYVSGLGTDSTEKSRTMWARVKGKTENELLKMPFSKSYMFRPGFIQPLRGIKSSTKLYNAMYTVFKPLYPLLKTVVPNQITTTEKVGQAMINVVLYGYDKNYIYNKDINLLAGMTDRN